MASNLHGIGEIIAYQPYEFGFVPRHSIVLVALRDGHVAVGARVDRPTSGVEAEAAAQHLATSLARSDPDDVLVVCYDGFGSADRHFVLELSELLRGAAVEMSHVAIVDAGRWRVEQCSCDGCPRDWEPVPPAVGVGPIAEKVARGVVPVERRADLAKRLEVRHPLVARAVERRIAHCDDLRFRTSRVLPRVLLDGRTPVHHLPVDVLAGATVAVEAVGIRDEVLSWLMPDFLATDVTATGAPVDPHHLGLPPMWLRETAPFEDPVAAVAARLEEWIGCIPPERSVPVLMLLAGVRWVSGSGVLASMAVDRALAIDHRCRLAHLFARALHAGLRPDDTEQRPA